MLYLRSVSNYKHFQTSSFDAESVRSSLLCRPGERPSVYKAERGHESERLIVLHGMAYLPRLGSLDYILMPIDLFTAHGLRLEPSEHGIAHPLLRERHHDIVGLTEDKVTPFCLAISNQGVAGARLGKAKVRELARYEVADARTGASALALVRGREGWSFLWMSG